MIEKIEVPRRVLRDGHAVLKLTADLGTVWQRHFAKGKLRVKKGHHKEKDGNRGLVGSYLQQTS